MLRDIPVVAHDSRGRFIAFVPGHRDHEILVYNAEGTLSGTVGRYGAGPGEFRRVWDIAVGPNDSLYVLHDNALSVFDASGGFARDATLRPAINNFAEIVRLIDGGVVLTQTARRSGNDTLGLPLWHYNDEGQLVRSFGPYGLLGAYSRQSGTGYGSRIATVAPDGSYWFGDIGYRIEHADGSGELLRVIGATAPSSWNFPPTFRTMADLLASVPSAGQRSRRPQEPDVSRRNRDADVAPGHVRPRGPSGGAVIALRVMQDSLLLVLMRVPAVEWRQAVGTIDPERSDSSHTVLRPGYRQQLYDTVIDIVDTGTAVVVARTRIQGTGFVTRDGILYRPSITDAGLIYVEAFRIDLELN